MKLLKTSLYSLLALFLVLVVGATYFVVTFDANEYKPLIAEQVKQHTGRDLTLGDIKPSVFPWLGIELQQVSLSNAAGFSTQPMLQMHSLDVHIELLPLLKQEIKVDTLRLHGLQAYLAKNKQGKTNWDDIIEKQKTAATAAPAAEKPAATATEASSAATLPVFSVNGVELKDAELSWDDASTAQQIELHQLNLNIGKVALDKPMPIALTTQIKLAEPAVNAQLSLQTIAQFNLETQQLQLQETDLEVNADVSSLDIKALNVQMKTALRADLKKQDFNLPDLSLHITATGKAIPGGELNAQLNTDVHANLSQQTLRIKKLMLSSLGVNMGGQLQVTQLIDAPDVTGRVDIESFNPRKVLEKLAIALPDMQGEKSLQVMSLGFNVAAGLSSLELKPLQLTLDSSVVNGFVSVDDFAKPAIQYRLDLDQIVLDDYLPPAAPEVVANTPATNIGTVSSTAVAPVTPDMPTDTPIDLPVDVLRSLNVNGELNAQNIQGFGQTLQQLHIETQAANGLIKVPALNAKLLNGGLNSSAQLDVRRNTPLYQLAVDATGLEADSIVNPVLKDLLGDEEISLHGALNLNLSVNTKGQSVNQLMAHSNGQVALNMEEAVLNGVDAEYFVRNVVSDYLQSKKIPLQDGWRGEYTPRQTTAIKLLKATATIRNGVVHNNDLVLQASRFNITGAGTVNLPGQVLNYRAVVDMQPPRVKTTAEKLLDVPLAVNVKGAFAQPDISVDTGAWTKQAGQALTAEAKAEAKAKLQQLKAEQNAKLEKLKAEEKAKLEQLKAEKEAALKAEADRKAEEAKDKLKDKLKGLFN